VISLLGPEDDFSIGVTGLVDYLETQQASSRTRA